LGFYDYTKKESLEELFIFMLKERKKIKNKKKEEISSRKEKYKMRKKKKISKRM
jgi:hypothetical protein